MHTPGKAIWHRNAARYQNSGHRFTSAKLARLALSREARGERAGAIWQRLETPQGRAPLNQRQRRKLNRQRNSFPA